MATVSDAGELREDVPLRKGAKSSRFCSCDEEFLGGPRFISIIFAVLTAIITVALFIQIYSGDYQVVPHGSVATDSRECSSVGTSILKEGGNAVDAAIASAFCLSVVNPHTTGLDAGGELLIYSHKIRTNPDVINFSDNVVESNELPRMVLGLIYVHQQFGQLPWKQLVEPAVNIANKGFLVPRMLETAIQNFKAVPLYGPLEAGQILTMPILGNTLQKIADIPEEALYKYITPKNQPIKSKALQSTFKFYNIYASEFPSVGPILFANLRRIENANLTTRGTENSQYVYTLAQLSESVYAEVNMTHNFFQGTTSNVAVMDQNDLYVSFVSGMYAPFGSRQMTSAGYLLDIKTIPLPPTRIPLIITDGEFICGRRMVLGANDVATASQVIASLLIAAENVTLGVEAPRFTLLDDGTIGLEDRTPEFTEDVKKYLETLGKLVLVNEPYNSCNVVEKVADDLTSHSDSRGGGIGSRFR